MENFRAASYAVTAGIMLVIVLYIAYIAIPIIIIGSVMAVVYHFNKATLTTTTKTSSNKTTTNYYVKW